MHTTDGSSGTKIEKRQAIKTKGAHEREEITNKK
jgi:hypothetical protein